MKPSKLHQLAALLALSVLLYHPIAVLAQTTAFNFQGFLTDQGAPANGVYDVSFSLYTAASGGTLKGGPLVVEDVAVTNGLFTVTIDFGTLPFGGGGDRWMQIGVRPGVSAGAFTLLSARQQITSTPYAITALSVSGPIQGSSIVAGSISGTQLAAGAAAANLGTSGQSGVATGGVILSSNANATDLLNAGYVKLGQAELGELWQARALAGSPTARYNHSAVWTGSEMIIWGGYDGGNYLNTGARYNPVANSWVATSTFGAPTARYYQTAVWTGSEMIVWGGINGSTYYGDGARYNPVNDQWTSIPASASVAPRYAHTAVWTGGAMLVFGGLGSSGTPINSGGRITSSGVTNISTVNAPAARYVHQAVWTGTEMIVWGGAASGSSFHNTGGHYNPTTDTWTTTSASPLSSRYAHTMVWTGTKALIWGGLGSAVFGDGAQYDPGPKTWSVFATNNAPAGRFYHQAVWTGSRMIISGGALAFGTGITNAGGLYDPAANAWSTVSTTNSPSPRYVHTAIWNDNEMMIWGGTSGSTTLDDGKKYDPALNRWSPMSGTPAPRYSHSSVWTGSELIIWGGTTTGGATSTGFRYSPVTDNWTPTSSQNAPSARSQHAGAWTGTEMLIWGGSGSGPGGRYYPASDSWTAMSTVGEPFSVRDRFASVWTGTELVVWGGYSGGAIALGGRYAPATDSWTGVTSTGEPTARFNHTAVWTGTEMLVWGGNGNGSADSGGRYSPSTDTWVSLPSGGGNRASHSAVWTGSEMIVWGGLNAGVYLNTGARYNRSANSWSATTTIGAPPIRYQHTAIWTGSAMIIWGGNYYTGSAFVDLNSGGRYDPISDSWSPTTSYRVPAARSLHTAVWTGNEMFIFGGFVVGPSSLNSLSSYTPAKTVYLYQKP